MPENTVAAECLESLCQNLKLTVLRGQNTSPLADEIYGKTFFLEQNPMGISQFTLWRERIDYVNEQGAKSIRFDFGKNVLQPFGQTGYSKDVGAVRCEGHTYRCAASAAWVQPNKFKILVQIIDEYIGVLDIIIGINGGKAVLKMVGDGEDFLREYNGFATSK